MKINITKNNKRSFNGLLIALAIGGLCCLISFFQLFSTLNQKSGDLLYQGQKSGYLADTADKIVIVGIDDETLSESGRVSAWPRAQYVKLLEALKTDGARIITFDILFSEPSADDAELAAVIKDAGNVILPVANTQPTQGSEYAGLIRPVPILEEGVLATGHGNMDPDADGIVRDIPVLLNDNDNLEPSLALVTVSKYLRRPQVFDANPDKDSLVLAGRNLPLQDWHMLINFTRGSSSVTFKVVSFSDVLKGTIPPDTFKDKIVLIGVTALGFGDVYWTPLGRSMSGVEIHAQAMNTILSGQFIRLASSYLTYLVIMLFAAIIGLVTLRTRVLWSTLLALFMGICYCLMAFYLFDRGLQLNLLYPLLSLAAVFAGMSIYNVTLARMEKEEIHRTFGRYVSPPVAAKILNNMNKGSLELGGEECTVTVMFADVRNFTSYCETMKPALVVQTLNRYFSVIINSILQHDGIISKFGGDNIMAVWNAPIKCPEHTLHAAQAAIDAQAGIRALRKDGNDIPEMRFGIGINTGKAIVGNMGSLDRLEYSLIGDTVNIAARLSSLVPGGKIWIGPEAYESLKYQYEMIPIGPLALKGKEQSVNVYELCSTSGAVPDMLPSNDREGIKVPA